MKHIILSVASVLSIHSIASAQAMQTIDIVAQMDAIYESATFLPEGKHLGKSSNNANCAVSIVSTDDGGLIANINSDTEKSLASIHVLVSHKLVEDSLISKDQVIIGYEAISDESESKTMQIDKLSKSKARVMITESVRGQSTSTACEVKLAH